MDLDENDQDKKPAARIIVEENKKRRRSFKHDKRWSKKKRKDRKIENSWEEYFKFMETNLKKQKQHRESPHIVISKSFQQIKKNSLILKRAYLTEETC